MPTLADQDLGLARATARRSSPASIAARAWSPCSMSAPICAGRTCRCRAPSSRCCAGLIDMSGHTAEPGAGVAAKAQRRDGLRRCARSTVSARSARRRSTARPVSADYRDRGTRGPSARLHATAPMRARSRSTRSPPPTGIAPHRRPRASMRAQARPIPAPNRATCAASCCRRRARAVPARCDHRGGAAWRPDALAGD